MTEKKVTKTAPKTVKKSAAKKVAATVVINSENAGFKAGDVYQALASEGKALSVEEIAKVANISLEEAYLGIGWLFKEYKIVGQDNKVALA